MPTLTRDIIQAHAEEVADEVTGLGAVRDGAGRGHYCLTFVLHTSHEFYCRVIAPTGSEGPHCYVNYDRGYRRAFVTREATREESREGFFLESASSQEIADLLLTLAGVRNYEREIK